MNFPDILSTICDTRFPIPLSAFGIDLTLILQWPDTSLDTQHLPKLTNQRYLLESRGCRCAAK